MSQLSSLWLPIAAGGALGACARHGVALWLEGVRAWPVATFAVNVAGSVLLGVAVVLLAGSADGTRTAPLAFTAIGFCGAFTTFSTFSLQTLELLQAGRLLAAGGYVLASVLCCVIGCAVGVQATRTLIQ